ncbi:phytosulfokines [Lolium rigidum]|uniref:phytosulfokines n=1 Tax=Lolium rigidum TaxID=89674 RepID=UPI001F5D4F8B|nr:phytosulfokines [Lolium rigidum]
MASFSKQATLLLVAALLLLCLLCPRGQAARPGPGSSNHRSQGAESAIAHEKSSAAGTGMVMAQEDPVEAMRDCEGGEGAEECLMRRTLVAHTDYIYTQGKHN